MHSLLYVITLNDANLQARIQDFEMGGEFL